MKIEKFSKTENFCHFPAMDRFIYYTKSDFQVSNISSALKVLVAEKSEIKAA